MPPTYLAEHVLEPLQPLDLALTLSVVQRGASDPTLRIEEAAGATRVHVAARVGEVSGGGVAAILEQRGGPGTAGPAGPRFRAPIRVRAWGPEPAEVEAFLRAAPALVGLEDDWAPFTGSEAYRLIPEAARAGFRRRPGLRLPATGQVVKQTITAIFEQRVTSGEAIGAWQRLVRRHGEVPPPPPAGLPGLPEGMRVFPRPADWLAVPSWEWHRHGVDVHRARAVRRLAELAPSLSRFGEGASPGELARALAGVPGVGPWTIAEAMQRSHGLPDAVSVGDYHLAHRICVALEGRRGDDDRMLELLAPWRGNRQRVVRILLLTGAREQKHGPRLAPGAHRLV